jgi:uncharacterized membrane protein YeaQ/YmgE (transglycosylase-associated protein family)
MGIILWIVFGAIVGWISSLIMKTNSSQGFVLDVIVGIIGAVIGGWIMNIFGNTGVSGFNLYGLLVAILGAVVFLFFLKLMRAV